MTEYPGFWFDLLLKVTEVKFNFKYGRQVAILEKNKVLLLLN
jgi:hypothetical protein